LTARLPVIDDSASPSDRVERPALSSHLSVGGARGRSIMFHKLVGLAVVVCVGSLVAASYLPQDKDKKTDTKEVKARIVKVDADKKLISVTLEDGKKLDLTIAPEVKFVGPRGGVSKEAIKDDRVTPNAQVVLVYDASGKSLLEIHLPVRSTIDEPKPKEKPPVKDQ
jgi:hypothetical protein